MAKVAALPERAIGATVEMQPRALVINGEELLVLELLSVAMSSDEDIAEVKKGGYELKVFAYYEKQIPADSS